MYGEVLCPNRCFHHQFVVQLHGWMSEKGRWSFVFGFVFFFFLILSRSLHFTLRSKENQCLQKLFITTGAGGLLSPQRVLSLVFCKAEKSYKNHHVNAHFTCLESTTRTSSHNCWHMVYCLTPEKNLSQRVVWPVCWIKHMSRYWNSSAHAMCNSLSSVWQTEQEGQVGISGMLAEFLPLSPSNSFPAFNSHYNNNTRTRKCHHCMCPTAQMLGAHAFTLSLHTLSILSLCFSRIH